MNRREFLKCGAVVPVVAFMPSVASAAAPVPKSRGIFHAFDGIEWFRSSSFEEAREYAQDGITNAIDWCDPEWPDEVTQIAIYQAPEDCEWPDEDGT